MSLQERITKRIVEQVVDVPVPPRASLLGFSASRQTQVDLVVWRHAVRKSHWQVEISTLGWVSVGLKIYAESLSTGSSRPASHKSSTLRAHQLSRRGKRQEEEPEVSEAPKLDDVAEQVSQEPQHKGRQGDAFVYDVHRTSVQGKSPKEARAKIRAAPEPGFYICRSGKKKVRTLHPLGRCYLLPGVDYMDYTFAGNATPKRSEYDGVGRLCARDGVRNGEDSSATVSFLLVV